MRLTAQLLTSASIAALVGCLGIVPTIANAADNGASASTEIAQGKALAFNRKKGNCLACHKIAGGKLPGNIGPPLVSMKARFPDYNKLRAQIYDARVNNPNTIMPPFGAYGILTSSEIDKVAKFIQSL